MTKAFIPFHLPIWCLCLVFALSFPSCTHDPSNLDTFDTICFESEILPLIQLSCNSTACHGGSAEGFSGTDYQSIMQYVVPGDPRGSTLYKVITDINGENLMPPNFPLTKQQRTLIHIWISQGALETRCDTSSGGNIGNINADSICFVQKILPLFTSKCVSCHDGTAHGEEDDVYALNSYESVRQHVNPFNPAGSDVYRAVTGSGEDFMPPSPNPPMTQAEKEMLRKWIADGAFNSDCPSASCDSVGLISFSAQIYPVLQNNCLGCHNNNLANGNVNFSTYNGVLNATQVTNGHPKLIGVVKRLPGFVLMPPTFTLDACSVRKMELWIAQGSLNN